MKEVGTSRSDRKKRYIISYRMTLKKKRGYWQLKEEALDCTLWKTRFGRCYGPVLRETAE
jgi:hypothetical protein